MKVQSIDHLVLTVKDIDATCAFYTEILGAEKRKYGNGRVALHFGSQKINLHQYNRPVDPNVLHATPGSADICLIVDTNIDEVIKTLKSKKVKLVEGPCNCTGAVGPIESVYIYDPDENLIELSCYI